MGWKYDYYADAVSEGADVVGLKLTDEQLKSIVDSVLGNLENESLASGSFNIPNPMQSEVRQLEKRLAEVTADAEKQDRKWAEAFGRKVGTSSKQISLDRDGQVWLSDGRSHIIG